MLCRRFCCSDLIPGLESGLSNGTVFPSTQTMSSRLEMARDEAESREKALRVFGGLEAPHFLLSHGRSKGQVRPATVVRNWGGPDNPKGALNLQVHTDHTNDFDLGQNGSTGLLWATSVPYSANKEPGTWHYQENYQTQTRPSQDKHAQVERAFTYHKPKADQQPKYEQIRGMAKEFALALLELTPESREQSLALTDLERCVMMANAAITRHG